MSVQYNNTCTHSTMGLVAFFNLNSNLSYVVLTVLSECSVERSVHCGGVRSQHPPPASVGCNRQLTLSFSKEIGLYM